MARLAVLGSGAWGTAIALLLARNGHRVALWSHSAAVNEALLVTRENSKYLPAFPLPPEVFPVAGLQEALEGAELIIGVVPSHAVRAVYSQAAEYLFPNQAIVSATKGLEMGTALRMSEVIASCVSHESTSLPIAVLGGPSFALEVAAGLPTAVTIASRDITLATYVQHLFASPSMRLYTNDDLVGVELGGALKNVIALAAGIASGLNMGSNGVAALMTRGIAEVTRLSVACGARAETLAGLAGLGDLVLTCTGTLSRNRHVGVELGKGRNLAAIVREMNGKVAEGVTTTAAALGLAKQYSIELPIAEKVSQILELNLSPLNAMRDLMSRPGRDE